MGAGPTGRKRSLMMLPRGESCQQVSAPADDTKADVASSAHTITSVSFSIYAPVQFRSTTLTVPREKYARGYSQAENAVKGND